MLIRTSLYPLLTGIESLGFLFAALADVVIAWD